MTSWNINNNTVIKFVTVVLLLGCDMKISQATFEVHNYRMSATLE